VWNGVRVGLTDAHTHRCGNWRHGGGGRVWQCTDAPFRCLALPFQMNCSECDPPVRSSRLGVSRRLPLGVDDSNPIGVELQNRHVAGSIHELRMKSACRLLRDQGACERGH
jgi:hypothetical protein